MKNRKNIPLIEQSYIYIGESNERFINGESYRVVDVGYHYYKEFGFVVWVAHEDYKDATDIDYCVSMSPDMFNGWFWR